LEGEKGMRHRRVILFSLVVLLALAICQAAARRKHIPGFRVVKHLPETMVAGETVEWQVSLVNPQSENASMNITLQITEEHGIGLGEFTVEGILESYDNPPREHHSSTLTFTETNGGIFQNQTSINERFNRVTLRISSVPNLMPGTYTFTLNVTQHVWKG